VKKKSPVVRFFASMKTRFTIIVFVYTVLSVVVWCAGGLYSCLKLYEETDIINLRLMVKTISDGIQASTNALIERGGMGAKQIGEAFNNDFSILNDLEKTEEILARYVHDNMETTTDASGLLDYESMPINLFMMWDDNWAERLVYYRPCNDTKNRVQCDLMPREAPFVDYVRGDFRMAHKKDVPAFFRRIKEVKPTKCSQYGDCVGIADIPNDQGGPMMYSLTEVPSNIEVIPEPLRGWHMLWASNVLFLNEIIANRTGLCIAGYSSTEPDLPREELKEYERKKKQGLLIDPHDLTTTKPIRTRCLPIRSTTQNLILIIKNLTVVSVIDPLGGLGTLIILKCNAQDPCLSFT